MKPSALRVLLVAFAVVAVAVSAAGVPFDARDDPVEETRTPTTERNSETPETPAEMTAPFAWLSSAAFYVFVGVLGAITLAAVAVVYRSLSGTESTEPELGFDQDRDFEAPAAENLESIAETAGRAADRIERGETLDNEVYRAWKEMTDNLNVANRRTRTPGEFAATAVRAGMAPGHVHELTALFEAVRYGTREPTAADERRAVALLRNIESEYGGDRE